MSEGADSSFNGSSEKGQSPEPAMGKKIKWKVPLDVRQLCEILPHRPPFLFIDRIIKLDDRCACGIKNVTISELYFHEQTAEGSRYPETLILESISQVGAVLALTATNNEGQLPHLAAIEKAKFHRPIRAGEQMQIEVKVVRLHKKYGKFRAEVTVDGTLSAEADIVCTIPV